MVDQDQDRNLTERGGIVCPPDAAAKELGEMAHLRRGLELSVPRMTCRHCVRTVTSRLRDVPGVQTVEADAARAWVLVRGTMTEAAVSRALEACGFPGVVTADRPI
jgi:copper chaperone CopZ